MLGLCDGKDPKWNRLIGTIVSKDWFTTLEAVSTGITSLAAIRNKCHKIIQEHLKQPFTQEYDIKVFVFGAVDLFGMKQETIDWSKTSKNDFEGSVNIEIRSDNLDSRLSKNTLIAQINAEWKDSLLKELRDQLFIFNIYQR